MVLTAPQLFALARGIEPRLGPHRCFYCGGRCAAECLRPEDHVKATFTAHDTVAGGDRVCDGCVAAMDERATIRLVDGTTRERQKVRNYSWLIFEDLGGWHALAATKSHRRELALFLLEPPAPPFVFLLSDSGQRQLLYRAAVSRSDERVTVTLEEQRIVYRPSELEHRLRTTKRVCAVVGGAALRRQPTITELMRLAEVYGDHFAEAWRLAWNSDLTRLAAWLTPDKATCKRDLEEEEACQRKLNELRLSISRSTSSPHWSAS